MWLSGLRAEQAWGGDIQHGARGELVNFERMPSKCRGTVPGSRTWQISFARSGCPFRLTVRSHGYAYQAIRDYRPYRRLGARLSRASAPSAIPTTAEQAGGRAVGLSITIAGRGRPLLPHSGCLA